MEFFHVFLSYAQMVFSKLQNSYQTQEQYLHIPLAYAKCEYIQFIVEASFTVC